jgi:hypothetical protein
MTPPSPRKSWPTWVRVVLWKTGRSTARTCVWLSLFAAMVCGTVAICLLISNWALRVAAGSGIFTVLFAIGAIVYDRAIAWVDRKGTWS